MRRRLGVVVAAAALALGACKAQRGVQTAGNPGAVPPDTAQIPKTPPPPPGGAVAAKEQHIRVSNTTHRVMKVVAIVAGRTEPLGSVEPTQQADLFLQAPVGTPIRLVASDSSDTHRVQGMVVASDSVLNWIIR